MTAAPEPPQVRDLTVILVDDDVRRVRRAVRTVLNELRIKYRRSVRRGEDHYADGALRKWDEYAELYEQLGGNIDELRDPDDSNTGARP